MISTATAIFVAIIGAVATIAAAMIMAKANSRSTQLPPPIYMFPSPVPTQEKQSTFFKIVRNCAWGVVGVIFFAGAFMISGTIPIWIGIAGTASNHSIYEQRLLAIIFFLTGAILICIANWLRNLVNKLF
jgi:hypothetical protein